MTEVDDQPISFEGRQAARRLRETLKVLVSLHRRISLPQMMTFVRVMMDEGLAVSTLADRVGVKPNTISKHLRTWDMLAAVETKPWAHHSRPERPR